MPSKLYKFTSYLYFILAAYFFYQSLYLFKTIPVALSFLFEQGFDFRLLVLFFPLVEPVLFLLMGLSIHAFNTAPEQKSAKIGTYISLISAAVLILVLFLLPYFSWMMLYLILTLRIDLVASVALIAANILFAMSLKVIGAKKLMWALSICTLIFAVLQIMSVYRLVHGA